MNINLTKDAFCVLLNRAEDSEKLIDELSEVMRVPLWECERIYLVDAIVNFLNDIFELDVNEDFGTDIDFFVYELHFGHKWKPGVFMVDGEDVKLRDAEDLWDYLTNINK